MDRSAKSLIFFVVLAANILSVQFDWTIGIYLTKPLLIPLLGWILFGSPSKGLRWIWTALLFSWLGDILLMLPMDLFLFGLASFLIAHLFYIRHFWGAWKRRSEPIRLVYLVGVALYLIGLTAILSPVLGEMRIPVIVYGLVISAMLLFALHAGATDYAVGAVLFVLSDSILALNKFHTSFLLAGSLIMLTYGLAQYFIVTGATRVEKVL
jgi:uncharacterized membrane protein YhhN